MISVNHSLIASYALPRLDTSSFLMPDLLCVLILASPSATADVLFSPELSIHTSLSAKLSAVPTVTLYHPLQSESSVSSSDANQITHIINDLLARLAVLDEIIRCFPSFIAPAALDPLPTDISSSELPSQQNSTSLLHRLISLLGHPLLARVTQPPLPLYFSTIVIHLALAISLSSLPHSLHSQPQPSPTSIIHIKPAFPFEGMPIFCFNLTSNQASSASQIHSESCTPNRISASLPLTNEHSSPLLSTLDLLLSLLDSPLSFFRIPSPDSFKIAILSGI